MRLFAPLNYFHRRRNNMALGGVGIWQHFCSSLLLLAARPFLLERLICFYFNGRENGDGRMMENPSVRHRRHPQEKTKARRTGRQTDREEEGGGGRRKAKQNTKKR